MEDNTNAAPKGRLFGATLIGATAAGLAASFFGPADTFTWFLEVAPALIGAVVLAATYKRFPLSRLVYALLAFHALVLMYGGAYTYALNPSFAWLAEILDLERNYYDRLGHFVQGFVPALLAREVLLRKTPLRPGGLVVFLVTSVCLAFSAFYELIEWWVAVATGEAAEAFLGTQGDVWDTQWDMFLCLCGALASQLSLGKIHDKFLDRMAP